MPRSVPSGLSSSRLFPTLCAMLAGALLLLPAPQARAQQNDLLDLFQQKNPLQDFQREVTKSLKEALGQSHPDATAALEPRAATAEQQAHVRDLIVKLIKDSATAPAAHRPALLLAANQLAEKISCKPNVTANCSPMAGGAPALKLTWEKDKSYGTLYYADDLLWAMRKNYSETPWGEFAFVMLLSKGYSTAITCDPKRDAVREVARQGDAYLAAHPASRNRAVILFLTAQAYDTWWSLSQSAAAALLDDSGWSNVGDAERYKEGASAAREKAAFDYQEAAKLAPGTLLAAESAKRAEKLAKGQDTDQRAYYCFNARE